MSFRGLRFGEVLKRAGIEKEDDVATSVQLRWQVRKRSQLKPQSYYQKSSPNDSFSWWDERTLHYTWFLILPRWIFNNGRLLTHERSLMELGVNFPHRKFAASAPTAFCYCLRTMAKCVQMPLLVRVRL